MNDTLNRAFALALELEGLIQLAISRGELLPTEAEMLMTQKAEELNELICSYCNQPEIFSEPSDAIQSSAEAVEQVPEAVENGISDGSGEKIEPQVQLSSSLEPLSNDDQVKYVEPAEPHPAKTVESRDDLSRLLSLNDRFRFRRELFHNSKEEMSEGIAVINSMTSYEEAADYLTNDLCVDETTAAGEEFLGIVERFFSNH